MAVLDDRKPILGTVDLCNHMADLSARSFADMQVMHRLSEEWNRCARTQFDPQTSQQAFAEFAHLPIQRPGPVRYRQFNAGFVKTVENFAL